MSDWQDDFCELQEKQTSNEHYKRLWDRYGSEILEFAEDAVEIMRQKEMTKLKAENKDMEDTLTLIIKRDGCRCNSFTCSFCYARECLNRIKERGE